MDYELALSLICNKQMLVEIFQLVSEETAHVSTPAADSHANAFDRQYFIDKRHL
jgi:hypothetical protein